MKILISGSLRVTEIQRDFNLLFPFLNLEFFDLSTDQMSSYTSSANQRASVYIRDIRKKQVDGELVLNPNMTIMQLEHLLSDEFGLQAQVFVRSKENWVRSSLNG